MREDQGKYILSRIIKEEGTCFIRSMQDCEKYCIIWEGCREAWRKAFSLDFKENRLQIFHDERKKLAVKKFCEVYGEEDLFNILL